MTHPLHPIAIREAVQALAENGFDGMAQAMELLLNEWHEGRAATSSRRRPVPAR